jgi:hypothetical protein
MNCAMQHARLPAVLQMLQSSFPSFKEQQHPPMEVPVMIRFAPFFVLGSLFAGPSPAFAVDDSTEIRVAQPLPEISRFKIVQGCIDSGGEQAVALVSQILRQRGIALSNDAPLALTVTTTPCDEFSFADQGPRDLQDAPKGPIGSTIITPINKSRKAPDKAALRLTITNVQKTVFWDGRAKSGITAKQSSRSAALDLILPLLNKALSQRSISE